ncbi:MAG: universal stress protein [Planctomycetota bacterium]|nr:universal stress protein [Planctomycetota bacterium]MDA1214004.1 universal stress protein [Planctomycetota bacterium]
MKILLAVDASDASEKAVRHVGAIFGSGGPRVQITLYHAMESLPEYLVSRITGPQQSEEIRNIAQEWVADTRQKARELLSHYQTTLIDAGLPAAAIEIRIAEVEAMPGAQKVVAAVAIIEEMKQGQYEIVCLGRRGDSGMISVFPGSVAEKVLRQAASVTVWIVD